MLCREVFFSQMLTEVCCNRCPHFHDLVLGLGVEFGFGGWRTFCEVFWAFRVGAWWLVCFFFGFVGVWVLVGLVSRFVWVCWFARVLRSFWQGLDGDWWLACF